MSFSSAHVAVVDLHVQRLSILGLNIGFLLELKLSGDTPCGTLEVGKAVWFKQIVDGSDLEAVDAYWA